MPALEPVDDRGELMERLDEPYFFSLCRCGHPAFAHGSADFEQLCRGQGDDGAICGCDGFEPASE